MNNWRTFYRCGRMCQQPMPEWRELYRRCKRVHVCLCWWLHRQQLRNKYVATNIWLCPFYILFSLATKTKKSILNESTTSGDLLCTDLESNSTFSALFHKSSICVCQLISSGIWNPKYYVYSTGEAKGRYFNTSGRMQILLLFCCHLICCRCGRVC